MQNCSRKPQSGVSSFIGCDSRRRGSFFLKRVVVRYKTTYREKKTFKAKEDAIKWINDCFEYLK